MRSYFSNFLDEDELEDFGLWAFGEEYNTFDRAIDFLKSWNKLHANALRLYADGKIDEDIPKMAALWKNRNLHEFIK